MPEEVHRNYFLHSSHTSETTLFSIRSLPNRIEETTVIRRDNSPHNNTLHFKPETKIHDQPSTNKPTNLEEIHHRQVFLN